MKRRRVCGARRERGQQLAEFSILAFLLAVGLMVTVHFIPDMLMIITIYLRGFFVVLGYPLG